MSNTIDTVAAIKDALSSSRIGTYEAAAGNGGPDDPSAVALYAWNAQVSAYLLMPLHICEVVVRNAAAAAIEAIHGPDWPWNLGFLASLPPRYPGIYSPLDDLQKVSRAQPTTGKVIPELKFAFWENMFTVTHDARIWQTEILRVFPHHPQGETFFQLRGRINADLLSIRRLRNRIAHHEPIFTRNLASDFARIRGLVALRSADVASWMMGNQIASDFISKTPFFCGGERWSPTETEIAEVAYAIWEREGRQNGCAERHWQNAISRMKGR
jgi:hypothetical protein